MSDHLRIERIRISRLFDRFSYNIDLRNENDVSILIAPNGYGKTTIFNIVNFIWSPSLSHLKAIEDIPFDFCECALSNGKSVILYRPQNIITNPFPKSFKCKLFLPGEEGTDEEVEITDHNEMIQLFNTLTETRSKNLCLQVINSDIVKDSSNFEIMMIMNDLAKGKGGINSSTDSPDYEEKKNKNEINSKNNILNLTKLFYKDPEETGYVNDLKFDEIKDDNFLPFTDIINFNEIKPSIRNSYDRYIQETYTKIIDFLNEQGCDIPIHFIQANRVSLINFKNLYDENKLNNVPSMIEIIQRRAQNFYTATINEYNKVQQEMKDKLPRMYIEHSWKENVNFNEFEKRWNNYITCIDKYTKIGLLPETETILTNDELHDAYDKKPDFLITYLDVFEHTLAPLEESFQDLNLFLDIINQRLKITKKEILFSKKGFCLFDNHRQLSIDCLSSGEKNDFIMFYFLIFYSKGAVVLIDEPEISLHIKWQEEYLDRLLQICEMKDLQAIVATHSPNIINGHFELIAEKEERDEDEPEE